MTDVARASIGEATLARTILSDGELEDRHLNLDVARLLRDAVPWGQGFEEPCFDDRFELVERRTLKDLHLKLKLRSLTADKPIDAIAFHQADVAWPVGEVRHVAFRLAVNDYFADERVQLVVEHIGTSA
jgi:single-stranded-DNA-specific exonuclease